MPTAVLTDRERTAVQAYLRLLHTVRAAFGDDGRGPAGRAVLPVVPPSVLAEAEAALEGRGWRGTKRSSSGWCATGSPPG